MPERPPPALPPGEPAGPTPRRPAPAPRARVRAALDGASNVYWALAGILVIFATLGVTWVLYADNVPWADADFYFRSARLMADGQGYSHPFNPEHPPTAFHPVGYPWFLAHLWQGLGLNPGGCDPSGWPVLAGCDGLIQAGQLANVLLATLNIALVFALATLIRGPAMGLLSAALFAAIPSRLLFTSALMSEETFVTLVLLAVLSLVVSVRRPEWFWPATIAFGLAAGGAAFVRPLGILLLALPATLIVARSVHWRNVAPQLVLATLVAVAMLTPWIVRTDREVGGVTFVSNNGGINLWIGCHQNAQGDLTANGRWMDWWTGDAPASLSTPDEHANDAEARRLALECMRKHPFGFTRLSLAKGLYTFAEDWTYVRKWAINDNLPDDPVDPVVGAETIDALTYLVNGVYLVLLPLAAIGAFATFFDATARSEYRWLLAGAFALLGIVPLAFFGEPRFHVPLLPIIGIWAAEGIKTIADGVRARSALHAQAAQYEWRGEPWPR